MIEAFNSRTKEVSSFALRGEEVGLVVSQRLRFEDRILHQSSLNRLSVS